MKLKKLTALGLSLTLVLALAAGCTQKPAEAQTPTPAPAPSGTATPTPAPTPTPEPEAERPQVNLAMLKGPTGIGAAKLMADNDADATLNRYTVEVAAQPTDLVGKLTSGELDMAAMPTNLAASLWNKTGGGVELVALNTLGVLYILENGDTVHSMADLAGRTVLATGQGANPEYVLNYLLRQNGLEPGEDVTIEWKSSDEVSALMASGDADLCMLPVPASTAVLMQNQDVRAALDLNREWESSGAAGVFTMGCVVVRSDFAKENPEAVANFLTDYAASIDYVKANVDEAAELVAQYGITPKAAIAKAAIPQANLVCITGEDMRQIQDYYEVLYAADPASIGGNIPDDSFYYIP